MVKEIENRRAIDLGNALNKPFAVCALSARWPINYVIVGAKEYFVRCLRRCIMGRGAWRIDGEPRTVLFCRAL